MKIYIPYYERGWHIQTADSEEALRRVGHLWMYSGTVYGTTAYTTQEGAQAYTDKRYYEAQQSEYQRTDAVTTLQIEREGIEPKHRKRRTKQ